MPLIYFILVNDLFLVLQLYYMHIPQFRPLNYFIPKLKLFKSPADL